MTRRLNDLEKLPSIEDQGRTDGNMFDSVIVNSTDCSTLLILTLTLTLNGQSDGHDRSHNLSRYRGR